MVVTAQAELAEVEAELQKTEEAVERYLLVSRQERSPRHSAASGRGRESPTPQVHHAREKFACCQAERHKSATRHPDCRTNRLSKQLDDPADTRCSGLVDLAPRPAPAADA